jgi:hypothetical protein
VILMTIVDLQIWRSAAEMAYRQGATARIRQRALQVMQMYDRLIAAKSR